MEIDTTTSTLSSTDGDGVAGTFPQRTGISAQEQGQIWAAHDLWNPSFRHHEPAYVRAFALALVRGDSEEGYRRINMHDITEQQFEDEAKKAGRSRAAYLLKAKESDFILESFRYFGDHEKYPFADKRMLHNPFVEGKPITVPKGTAFTSTSGKSGVKGRAVKSTVEMSGRGYTSGSVNKLFVTPPYVRVVGSGGYYQTVFVTPDLLRANNLPIYEAPIRGDLQLRPDER